MLSHQVGMSSECYTIVRDILLPRILVLLRGVVEGIVDTHEGVRVVELEE